MLILLDIADGILTNILIQKDIAHEGNPFLQGIAGDTGLLIVKVVGILIAIVILWDINRRYPRLAFWTTAIFLVVYFGIVVWNSCLLIFCS
jgi:hypothetical protein